MSELFIKQEVLEKLPQLDAVLLDVDGVILDVAQTFRVVAAEVAQWYGVNILKLDDTGALFEAGECELFKNAGGFNNDWDLTNAAVALIVAKHAQSGATDTASVRAATPDFVEYSAEIKRRGGGLQVAERIILEMLTSTQRRDFANNWNQKLVTQLFQEMYAGEEMCRNLYGFTPEHIHTDGYLDKEPVLIDGDLLTSKTKNGVLTGRIASETQIALHRANLLNKIPSTQWVTEDDGVRKPDARALALLQEKMGFKTGVYIGDTLDDLRVVQNFRDSRATGRARVFSCLVLSGPAGAANRRAFLEAGAEIVAPDVNAVLAYFKTILK